MTGIKIPFVFSYFGASLSLLWGQESAPEPLTAFLIKYGWAGLFVLSCFVIRFLYLKMEKERKKNEEQRQTDRANFDKALEDARDELVDELKTRIKRLAEEKKEGS